MRDFELPIAFRGGLSTFCRDLTAAAMRNELEPVCCRDREIERVIMVLMRQSKNNPVLVGEAGVGKTAVAEALAQRISRCRVPEFLKGSRILSLSHVDLIAGTMFRGQYEKRLQSVIQEASADPGVILFIDELHNLIGAGSALGAPMDAANMLKPALAGGQLRVIGATTEREYETYIRGDSALERRFQPIDVRELGREETLEILRARRPGLELHHLFDITDEALEASADLSREYLPERLQPDRSIDLLDETCALMRLQQPRDPSAAVRRLKEERDGIIALEQQTIQQVLELAAARGNPLERFSLGTFKVLEAMGLGVERFLTGRTTARKPVPVPDSVRRLRETDPVGRLGRLHCERLRIEDQLKAALTQDGLSITAAQVRHTVESLGER